VAIVALLLGNARKRNYTVSFPLLKALARLDQGGWPAVRAWAEGKLGAIAIT